ncbi:hypothetical protein BDY24DRAFT_414645 [Mrakia frigida]|uniref:uncharacterized protein n=1 Tax=Mrakia frigida TaxID=29902 RepID=UPI003FCC0033
MIYTSLKPIVDIPSVDLHTYLFAPEFARPSDSPSNRSLVDAAQPPSSSLSQADVYRLSGELGAGLTKMWSAGITPLAPQPSLPLAALPYTHSKEEDKVTVAIFSPNTTSFALALLACLSSPLGIISTLASSSYQAEDLKYQLQDARAGILLVHPSLLGVAEEALRDEAPGWKDRVYILGDSLGGAKVAGYRDFSELRVGGEEGQRWREGTRPRADDTAFLCYSSGTTGRSKGVASTHRNVLTIVAVTCQEWPILLPGQQNVLQPLPAYHIFGLVSILTCLKLQVLQVFLKKFSPEMFGAAIALHQVYFSAVVPPMLVSLSQGNISKKHNLSSLKAVVCGAAPLGPELTNKVLKAIPHLKILQTYGLTETSPFCTVTPVNATEQDYGSIGLLLPNLQARLVDDDEKDVVKGEEERGELWIRGTNVMKGYWRNPRATRESITFDGWFKTGDIAIVNARGFFYIVDRKKELIKYKGFQVPPAELEAKLLAHELVADVGVIGVWDEERATEVPRAYVVPTGGYNSIKGGKEGRQKLEHDLERWIATQVSDYKRLRGGVHLIEVIPKSTAGKILRRQLRDLAAADFKSGKVQIRSKL